MSESEALNEAREILEGNREKHRKKDPSQKKRNYPADRKRPGERVLPPEPKPKKERKAVDPGKMDRLLFTMENLTRVGVELIVKKNPNFPHDNAWMARYIGANQDVVKEYGEGLAEYAVLANFVTVWTSALFFSKLPDTGVISKVNVEHLVKTVGPPPDPASVIPDPEPA